MTSSKVIIACYGDSNTWGEFPLRSVYIRINARWASLLEGDLNDGSNLDSDLQFRVIQNGLSGRYAGDINTNRPRFNGFADFLPFVQTQQSVDLVIVALGVNDLKKAYMQSPQNIFDNLAKYKSILADNNVASRVLYLLQPLLIEDQLGPEFELANAKLKDLYEIFAQSNLDFIDLNTIVTAEDMPDGIHYNYQAHAKIANFLTQYIRTQF
jgi:lysophospholipase L1-like esterase